VKECFVFEKIASSRISDRQNRETDRNR